MDENKKFEVSAGLVVVFGICVIGLFLSSFLLGQKLENNNFENYLSQRLTNNLVICEQEGKSLAFVRVGENDVSAVCMIINIPETSASDDLASLEQKILNN